MQRCIRLELSIQLVQIEHRSNRLQLARLSILPKQLLKKQAEVREQSLMLLQRLHGLQDGSCQTLKKH